MAKSKGDTKNKRTAIQVAEDREYIFRHYVKGIPHSKIAEQMVIDLKRNYVLSRQQVEYDIKHIVSTLKTGFNERVSDYVMEQLVKIDALEAEAWAAWENSKRARKETTITTKKNHTPQDQTLPEPAKDPQDITIKNIEQGGDVRYYEKLQWCIEIRLKMLGFFQTNQYTRVLDPVPGSGHGGSGEGGDSNDGIILYLPDNGR
jgi:hypothetical protein